MHSCIGASCVRSYVQATISRFSSADDIFFMFELFKYVRISGPMHWSFFIQSNEYSLLLSFDHTFLFFLFSLSNSPWIRQTGECCKHISYGTRKKKYQMKIYQRIRQQRRRWQIKFKKKKLEKNILRIRRNEWQIWRKRSRENSEKNERFTKIQFLFR